MIVQKCCPECGSRLIEKELENEGMVPYCNTCKQYRFPMYNVAVSMITIYQNKVLLVKQYGRNSNILVAGYVNFGEDLVHAVRRELMEEMNLEVEKIEFNSSKYYAPSNCLMCNFICYITDISSLRSNNEIDSYNWYPLKDALKEIKPDSTAKYFYEVFYEKHGKE